MSSFDFQPCVSTKDQDDLNNVAHLIHLINGSIDQTTFTPSFSSSSTVSISSALFTLLSPSHSNSSDLSKEGHSKVDCIAVNKEAIHSSSANIMSTYSPSSSTTTCLSPRTIQSNLSTPSVSSHAGRRLQEKIEENKNFLYFANPFIATSPGQTSYFVAQGSRSVPITTDLAMQSYFESSDSESTGISRAMEAGNASFKHQFSDFASAQEGPSISINTANANNTYVPQFGRPFPAKIDNHNYDERYWMNEQALASSQIKDFDMLIESLSAQRTTKTLSDRKRAPSKTFEDVMPYLSISSVREKEILGDAEALTMYKRSKTDILPWQSRTENLSNTLNEGDDQHADWILESLYRQRQRSKTTSIVYSMENAPIIPLKPSFSQLKEGIHLSPGQASNLLGVENVCDPTIVNITTCKFVEQAARTALKGFKLQDDSEVSKRASAGMKARDEQNREKSKRYYDRKKAQSSAMSGMFAAIELWQSTHGINLVDSLQTDLDAQQATNVPNQDFQLPSERQKASKELQRLKESIQIKTLTTCAEKLNELLTMQPKGSAAEIVVAHSNKNQAESSQIFRSKEFFILQSGLHIWLDYLHCWADLILAEKRLAQKNENRPIYQIICSLTRLL